MAYFEDYDKTYCSVCVKKFERVSRAQEKIR